MILDEDLVAKYVDTKDEHPFSILYGRYAHKVRRKCGGMLKNTELAKDSTHDVFIKVLTNIPRFNNKLKFSTWLYSITHNHCIDLLRKNRFNIVSTDIQDEGYDTYLESKLDRIEKALELMDDHNKTILLMKYQDDLSIKEMGDILGKGESAVKMKIHRAKQKFKEVHELIQTNKYESGIQ